MGLHVSTKLTLHQHMKWLSELLDVRWIEDGIIASLMVGFVNRVNSQWAAAPAIARVALNVVFPEKNLSVLEATKG